MRNLSRLGRAGWLFFPLAGCLRSAARPGAGDDPTATLALRVERGIVRRSAAGADSGPPTTLAARMAELRVPGASVAVFDGGRILWARGYGVADVTRGAPVD